MTGKENFNYNEFEKAELKLSKEYSKVINPHKIHGTDDKSLPYQFYMKNDIKALLDCDCIYLLKDWEFSKGAALEKQIAEVLKMEIYFQEISE